PPVAKPRARCQPMYRKDGLIEPLPNSGRGHKRVKATRQSARVPWNYNGPQWPPPSTVPEPLEPENPSSSEAAGLESEDDLADDPTQVANKASAHNTEPKSLAEAQKLPKEEADLYYQAAVEELQALIDHGVFELVKLLRSNRNRQ
ncbi:hypothetical protein HGRIS_008479, partial [Hohenbuehelia grisea]